MKITKREVIDPKKKLHCFFTLDKEGQWHELWLPSVKVVDDNGNETIEPDLVVCNTFLVAIYRSKDKNDVCQRKLELTGE